MAVMKALNPATGEVLADVEETNPDEIPEIMQRAKQAFLPWSSLPLERRLEYLRRFRQVLLDEMEEVVDAIVKDTGKVPTDALVSDLMPTLDAITHTVKEAEKILRPKGVNTPLLLFGKRSYVEYMPRGVVLVISPWNYPLQLSVIPVISALAGGNTVILKPSEVTPLVGKKIEEWFGKAGFPPYVVQVAHGGKEIGARLTEARPDYIFFTGSVRTGKIIQGTAAKYLIPTTLELGGKDPFIVFADAPLERAAKGAVWASFTNAGQVCMSAERIYVERSVYEPFLELMKQETEKLVLGTDPDSDVGAMTFPPQKEIVRRHVQQALARGARLITGLPPDEWDDSLFVKPMILTDVDPDLDIVCEETFGPVAPVIPFDSEEEAIELANRTRYGLNASIWTKDLKRARRVASRLVSGAVTINEAIISVANPYLPFGGAKESGIGRYHGTEGLTIFCHEKSIVVDRGWLKREIHWYPYQGTYPHFLRLFRSYFSERKNWVGFLRSFLQLLKR
jgi:Aldehyde dehydrogenase family.